MKKNDLFTLIKSMSKAEKRHFKLMSSKYDKGEKNNYLRLFDLIDRMDKYNEELVSKRFANINISYTKNYLCNAILKSLREFHSEISEDAQLKDLMRDAEILFRRGLYDMCYDMLLKAKDLAVRFEKFLFLLEILECERRVALRLEKSHELENVIARNREEEKKVLDQYINLTAYRDLSRNIFLETLKRPAPGSPEELKPFHAVYNHELLEDPSKAASFEALFNYHNILSLYYHAISDWKKLFEQRRMVVDLFESKKARDILGHDGMFVALNNYIVACTGFNKHDDALLAMQKLKALSSKIINFNKTHFSNTFTLELSILIYQKKFKEALTVVHEYLKLVDVDSAGIPASQQRILFYSIGYIMFANGANKEACNWLKKVFYDKDNTTRPDIFHFSIILAMLIKVDSGELEVSDVKKAIDASTKSGNYHGFEKVIYNFFISYIETEERKKHDRIVEFKAEMDELFKDPLQSRVLQYFDLYAWIESKLQKKSLLDVISMKPSSRDYSFFPEGFPITVPTKKQTKAEA
jgi:hypothetical protein